MDYTNVKYSNNRIFINNSKNIVRYYDIKRQAWNGISKDEGTAIFFNVTNKSDFNEAIKLIIESVTIKRGTFSETKHDYNFCMTDMRTKGLPVQISSDELKDFLLSKTKCKYINKTVRKELSGKRPSVLKPYLDTLDYEVYSDFFFVVANRAINSDKNTRYCILSESDCNEITDIFRDYIPVYRIQEDKSETDVSYLSKWFRETLGYGFCVTDVDFLIKNGDKILVIEEKVGARHNVSVGQEISRKEFLNDAIKSSYKKDYLYVEVGKESTILRYSNSKKEKELFSISDVIAEMDNYLK